MAKRGRKPTYDREKIADEVLAILSNSDRAVWDVLASNELFPSERQWYVWLEESAELQQKYARAREMQADYLAWQGLKIADDDSEDELFIDADETSGKSAKRVCNHEFVARSKLRIDQRKWLASKLAPKKYGDRITQEIEISDSLADAMKAARERANGVK